MKSSVLPSLPDRVLYEELSVIWQEKWFMTFDAHIAYNTLRPYFHERIRFDEPLPRHCAFGVGGHADVWVTVEAGKELTSLVSTCAEERWPLLIVGNGSNILYADAGVRGIVARIALHEYHIENQEHGNALLIAEAGVSWPLLLHQLAPLGWGGLEFGVGIPGTLGGGVISNAGAHNSELGQILEWIEVLDARGINLEPEEQVAYPVVRRYEHNELDLSYRSSRFRYQRQARFDERGHLLPPPRGRIDPAEIIILLAIRLQREDPQTLQAIMAEHRLHRKSTEPPPYRAGTVFKDPPGNDASSLLEQAGMNGKIHGKAQISPVHANYIVNLGGAHAADIAALIMEAHQRVLERFGIDLELDVEPRGEW